MKSILLAILLTLSVVSYADNLIRIEVPPQCVGEAQMASFVLQHYSKGVPRDEFEAFMDNMTTHPEADAEVVAYTRELIELIYGVEPKQPDDFKAVYGVVIERCLHEKPYQPQHNLLPQNSV